MTPNPTCADCGSEIETGESRKATEDGPIHEFCHVRRLAAERYTLHIANPPREGLGYSLWYDYGPFETAMLTNTGGLDMFHSLDKGVGEGIPVSKDFIMAIGYGWHDAVSFMGYDAERLDEQVIDVFYDNPVPDQDRWAIHNVVSYMWYGPRLSEDGSLPHEFNWLVKFADECTGFGVPDVRPNPIEAEDDGC